MVTNLDWYLGKDIVASQKERGRDAYSLHYIIAAIIRERELRPDDEIDTGGVEAFLIAQIKMAMKYSPVKQPEEKTVKALGF